MTHENRFRQYEALFYLKLIINLKVHANRLNDDPLDYRIQVTITRVVQSMKSMFFLLTSIIWNFKNLFETLNKLLMVQY
jgi:hypothetical protein